MSTFDPLKRTYRIRIEYCVPCSLADNAIAVANALLKEHQQEIDSITLVTGTGGVFDVTINDTVVYSKADTGKVPTPEEIEGLFLSHNKTSP